MERLCLLGFFLFFLSMTKSGTLRSYPYFWNVQWIFRIFRNDYSTALAVGMSLSWLKQTKLILCCKQGFIDSKMFIPLASQRPGPSKLRPGLGLHLVSLGLDMGRCIYICLSQKFDITIAPNMWSVCNTSKPQLHVPDKRRHEMQATLSLTPELS